MSDNRVELNDKMMDEVTGGVSITRESATSGKIGLDMDHLNYSYDSYKALMSWLGENVSKYHAGDDQKLINDLLSANLIH